MEKEESFCFNTRSGVSHGNPKPHAPSTTQRNDARIEYSQGEDIAQLGSLDHDYSSIHAGDGCAGISGLPPHGDIHLLHQARSPECRHVTDTHMRRSMCFPCLIEALGTPASSRACTDTGSSPRRSAPRPHVDHHACHRLVMTADKVSTAPNARTNHSAVIISVENMAVPVCCVLGSAVAVA